jgi:hypothetical protein
MQHHREPCNRRFTLQLALPKQQCQLAPTAPATPHHLASLLLLLLLLLLGCCGLWLQQQHPLLHQPRQQLPPSMVWGVLAVVREQQCRYWQLLLGLRQQ